MELLKIYLTRVLLNERKAVMEWKILIATFTSIFLAELGDKTQIAAIIMTSKTHKPLTVFIGSMITFCRNNLNWSYIWCRIDKNCTHRLYKISICNCIHSHRHSDLNWKIVNLQNRPAAVYTVTSCLLLLSHYPVLSQSASLKMP